ncbi:hypothetical protein K502DRAFT_339041 [Neoconidiobolus thromboides FSU 785]|nr:hypothetical protein K502DRAFT_339041 [Neoconidiobolus thromboides FSU 785]
MNSSSNSASYTNPILPIVNTSGPTAGTSISRTSSKSSSSLQLQPTAQNQNSVKDNSIYIENKRCWICFGEENDSEGHWIKPCHCSLISHEECLLSWIAENQKFEANKRVHCPQCNQVYQLSEPPSFFIDLFNRIDNILQSTVPYITLVGLTGSILVTSTTYGAYAVLTICGSEEGERLLGSPNPWGWRVWLGLPLIPWILIGSRSNYLDSLMPLLPILVLGNEQIQFNFPPSPSLVLSVLPWIRIIYNTSWEYIFGKMEKGWVEQIRNQMNISGSLNGNENNNEANGAENNNNTHNNNGILEIEWEVNIGNPGQSRMINRNANANDTIAYALGERKDIARTIVGALLLPALSSMSGNILGYFPMIKNRFLPTTFLRSIVGGCFFIFLKDITNLIYKYYLIRRLRKRTIQSVAPIQ